MVHCCHAPRHLFIIKLSMRSCSLHPSISQNQQPWQLQPSTHTQVNIHTNMYTDSTDKDTDTLKRLGCGEGGVGCLGGWMGGVVC